MAPFGPRLHVLPDTVLTGGCHKLWRVMAKAGRIMNVVQNYWKNPILKIYTSKGSQTSMMWSLEHQNKTMYGHYGMYGHYIFECQQQYLAGMKDNECPK